MSRNYRTYTKEFKLEALELLESSGHSAAQIERDLGITKGLLVKWRDRGLRDPAGVRTAVFLRHGKCPLKPGKVSLFFCD
jgi:transposase-like protein